MRYCLEAGAVASASSSSSTALINPERHLWFSLVLMPLGLFFDFMDGKVARWRRKSSLMGQELDSLADLVCGISFYLAKHFNDFWIAIFFHSHGAVFVFSNLTCRNVSSLFLFNILSLGIWSCVLP